MKLESKSALLTGAASGIGKEIAFAHADALTGQSLIVSHGWCMEHDASRSDHGQECAFVLTTYTVPTR